MTFIAAKRTPMGEQQLLWWAAGALDTLRAVKEWNDEVANLVVEAPCPCCCWPLGADDVLRHIMTPPPSCDRERWGLILPANGRRHG